MLISKFDLKRKMNKYKVRSQVPSDLQGRSLEPSLHPIRDPRALSPKGNRKPAAEHVRSQMGSWVQRALITKGALVETANRRNRLHHRGLWERTVFRIWTALTSLSFYIFWQRGCNGPLPGNAWRRRLNGHLSSALVQGPPLQAIWYCTTHRLATVNRVTDN